LYLNLLHESQSITNTMKDIKLLLNFYFPYNTIKHILIDKFPEMLS